MDTMLKQIDGLTWLPWIGQHYGEVPAGKKLLILGESHYHDGSEESIAKHQNPGYTRIIIDEMAAGRAYYKTKVFPNLHRALFGHDNFNARKFWDHVAFYNFIQRPMDTNKGRPKVGDINQAWRVFFNAVKVLQPDYVLFVGTTAADYLQRNAHTHGIKAGDIKSSLAIGGAYPREVTLHGIGPAPIHLVFIRHTSSHFKWQEWHQFLLKALSPPLDWVSLKV